MKKNIILPALLAMLAVTSCNNSSNQNSEPPAPAEKTVAPHDSTLPDGTSIKVNDQGISIENKEGSKKNSVKVSKDSASIEIKNPK